MDSVPKQYKKTKMIHQHNLINTKTWPTEKTRPRTGSLQFPGIRLHGIQANFRVVVNLTGFRTGFGLDAHIRRTHKAEFPTRQRYKRIVFSASAAAADADFQGWNEARPCHDWR
jgi:hypothetical protein